ncbi:hypothetical protein ACLB2K_003871 [Fragaria x ananassa]
MVLTGMVAAGEASDLRRLVMDHKELAEVFNGTLQKTEGQLLAELRHFYARSRRNGFHIVHICTEMEPLVSVGSLASYVTGLSRALQRKGQLVELILPNVVYGIGVTLIQPLEYSEFFNREKVYGYSDDFERFTYFSRASLDYIVKCGKQPDVIHIHNWETAIIGPLFWDIFAKQCLEHPDKLALCGLDPSSLHRPDRLQDNTKSHLVNILKLKALKYGTAPIALNSSHDNFRNFAEHDYETTNFSRFVSSTFGNMSISEALNEMKNHPSKWKRKILDAMEMDFSWDAECCDVHTSAYTSLKKL